MSNIESGSDVDDPCSVTTLNDPRISKLASVREEVRSDNNIFPPLTFKHQFIFLYIFLRVFVYYYNLSFLT